VVDDFISSYEQLDYETDWLPNDFQDILTHQPFTHNSLLILDPEDNKFQLSHV